MKKEQKSKLVLAFEIITVLSLIFIFLAYAFQNQITVLINIVLFSTLLFCFCFSMYKKIIYANKLPFLWTLEIVYLLMFLVIKITHYKFTSDTTPFLILSLLIGVVCGLVTVFLVLKKEKQFRGHISKIFTATLLSAIFTMIVFLNLNYALDAHKPQGYSVVITGKNIERHHSWPDTYEFMFEDGGKQQFIGVSKRIYDKYNVGDQYQLFIYDGAFGKEFYTSKDSAK